MPEPPSDKAMTREERIKWARAQAAENRDEILDRHEKQKADAAGRVQMLRDGEIRDRARLLDSDRTIPSIGPIKDEVPWANARRACRDYVIDSVRRDRRVNYDELRVLTYEVTGMTLGHSMFARMCMEINDATDDCLLSSWVVTQETGRPGSGFFDFARSKGYDLPLETIQGQVRDHFRIA